MQQNTNVSSTPVVSQQTAQGPNTGPLQAVGKWLGSWTVNRPQPSPSPHVIVTQQPQGTAFSRMRDKIEEFDEDYRNLGERLLGAFQQFAGYVVPFVMVIAVGHDLGSYFAPYMGGFSANLIAYAMECTIAALTIAMGRAFEHMSTGNAQWGKLIMTVGGWVLLNTSTALGLYALASNAPINNTPTGHLMLVVRVVAIALVDLGCSFVLMWRGKSIQKHIEAIHRKAAAIGSLADAERSMTEADKNAKLREQQMQATLKIQEDLSAKIGDAVSMVMTTILERMEKALKDEGKTKNESRYGRQ